MNQGTIHLFVLWLIVTISVRNISTWFSDFAKRKTDQPFRTDRSELYYIATISNSLRNHLIFLAFMVTDNSCESTLFLPRITTDFFVQEPGL